jgi:endoglucanase
LSRFTDQLCSGKESPSVQAGEVKHSRRTFIKLAALASASAGAGVAAGALPQANGSKLPRWHGFNLLEKFVKRRDGNPPYRESDFEWIAGWGFNFVRLPMSYLCWTDENDWKSINDDKLKDVDHVIEFGRQYGVHVNINFHRAPGYCVNPPKERLDLWSDDEALDACAFHWAHFAKRYKGVPNSQVSFDLLNEPGDIPEATYTRVVKRLVEAIRHEDPNRLIIADGLKWGTNPVRSLAPLGIAQSTRGYAPMQVSHWKASWMHGSDKWPEPTWPLTVNGTTWNKAKLRHDYIQPWKELEAKGVGVHVGEWGAYRFTPHEVVLAWMRDWLDLWMEARWGWSMWNFRGTFGVLDSERSDVEYENWRGHKLDRKMLELIRSHA